jgi:hypothetical protein
MGRKMRKMYVGSHVILMLVVRNVLTIGNKWSMRDFGTGNSTGGQIEVGGKCPNEQSGIPGLFGFAHVLRSLASRG